MTFAATWMDLEIGILHGVSQRKRHPAWILTRNDVSELIYNINRLTDLENELKVAQEVGVRDNQGIWDGHEHTAIFSVDNQQVPTVQCRELCSLLCDGPDGSDFGEDGYIYMYS